MNEHHCCICYGCKYVEVKTPTSGVYEKISFKFNKDVYVKKPHLYEICNMHLLIVTAKSPT